MGIRGKISRNTLAHANQTRDWRIYADFAQTLIRKARQLLCRRFIRYRVRTNHLRTGFNDDRPLSVSLPMGNVPQTQGSGEVTHASRPERQHFNHRFYYQRESSRSQYPRQAADEAGAIYIMDRGYLDYARLYKLNQSAAYFVTRAKNNARYHRRYYQKIDKTSGLKSDQ